MYVRVCVHACKYVNLHVKDSLCTYLYVNDIMCIYYNSKILCVLEHLFIV